MRERVVLRCTACDANVIPRDAEITFKVLPGEASYEIALSHPTIEVLPTRVDISDTWHSWHDWIILGEKIASAAGAVEPNDWIYHWWDAAGIAVSPRRGNLPLVLHFFLGRNESVPAYTFINVSVDRIELLEFAAKISELGREQIDHYTA